MLALDETISLEAIDGAGALEIPCQPLADMVADIASRTVSVGAFEQDRLPLRVTLQTR